jgi:hypothetical protein
MSIAVVVAEFLGGSADGSGTDVGLRMGAVVEDFAAPAESVVADILGTALAGLEDTLAASAATVVPAILEGIGTDVGGGGS